MDRPKLALHKKSTIARQFIVYIVLFSSFITIITTAIQLYRDYNSDIALIHSELQQIESVHLNSLISALWASNQTLLQTSIDGIFKIRDMQFVAIRDEDKVWAQAGEMKIEGSIQRSYSMTHRHRNKNLNIGTLTVHFSLDGVYQRLIDTVLVIFISNAVKTSLVALFIYILFQRLVGRHLSAISEFSEKQSSLSYSAPLSLERDTKRNDEFDAVVDSINFMHQRLHKQMSQIVHQKHHLSQTLNSIGDAVITTDEQGKITRLNPIAERLTGWTNDEALNQPLKTVFPIINATSRQIISDPVERILATGEIIHLSNHTTLISRDGTEYQIADSAAPILYDKKILGIVLVFNDVTEQYRIREALSESEKKYRLINNQIPGIVYQFKIDVNGNKSLSYVSPAIEKYLGLTDQAVMTDVEMWVALTHPDDYPSLKKSIKNSLAKLILWEWEGRFKRTDGELVWLHGTALPERMEDGSTVWNGVFIDVTDRVFTDEVIRRTQKMDALGKLTGGIAHDYNNMLGVILGYSDLLTERLDEQPKLQAYVDKISHAANRGAILTKKLLTFSKTKSVDSEKLDINKILKNEQQILEKTLTARIKLELKLADDLWAVYLNSGDLEDSILNMSINAMHAIINNGKLVIETCNITINACDAKNLGLTAGDYVQLCLSDTGSGMDQSTLDKIFDPFYSTKGEHGTGLGLSQVYGFVSGSNGVIKVDSKFNQGTRFSLYFPRFTMKERASLQINNKKITKISASSDKKTILVVDDEAALLELNYEILTQQNYLVLRASSAKKALQIIESEVIDLLISDVIMPDMDGYELAAIVKKKYPDIKIQLISGYIGENNEAQKNNELTKHLLQKPFNKQDLLIKIDTLFNA